MKELREEALETFGTLTKLLPSMVFPLLSQSRDEALPVLQTLALIKLDERGVCSLSELAEAVVTSRQSMTVLSGDLLEKGYIVRMDDPRDRRKVLVKLTPQGQQYVQHRYEISARAFVDFFVDFTDGQLAELLAASRQLNALLLQANYSFGEKFKEEARSHR